MDTATAMDTGMETRKTKRNPDGWDLVIKPEKRLLDIDLAGIWRYRDLWYMYVRRDIVTQYKQTILGPLWFFIQPIFTTVMYMFVFGGLAGISTDGAPQPLFYLSGIMLWNYFSECFNRSSDTFTRKLNIHILQCDDQIRSDQKITSLEELRRYMEDLPLSGGSATDFRPVFEYVEEPPLTVRMPAWAIRIIPTLPWKRPDEDFSRFWQEEILQELPEL